MQTAINDNESEHNEHVADVDDDPSDDEREPSPCEVQLSIIHATLAERR